MSNLKLFILILVVLFSIGILTARPAGAAVMIAQQTDSSLTGTIQTGCNNACTDIAVGSQIFTAAISGNLGSLKIFTSNFGTMSRNPDSNSCYLTIYDQDSNTLLASSDNGFSGYGCAGDLVFTFKNSQPFLRTGRQYRWTYMFGMQNFSSITFIGGPNDTVGGSFSVMPLGGAKFNAFAVIMPPEFLSQFLGNGTTTPLAYSSTSKNVKVTLAATLPAPLPDSLRLQIELVPSYISFKGEPNLVSGFMLSDSSAKMTTSDLLNGPYHWQARAMDTEGNTSAWQPMNANQKDPDFYIYDPSDGTMIRDITTIFTKSAQPDACFGDCPLSPSVMNYQASASFVISKLTFDWHNGGGNNCDDVGHYGAIITGTAALSSPTIARSTNTVYVGCGGVTGNGSGGAAEFNFESTTIPSNFFLSFIAFDGALQGGSNVSFSNIAVFGTSLSSSTASSTTTTPTQEGSPHPSSTQKEPVVVIPGILGSHLNTAATGREIWPDANTMIFSRSDSYLDDLKLSHSGEQISGKEMVASDIIRAVTTSIPFASKNFYKPLIDSLIADGYREGIDLFVAPYDWRLDSANSAAAIETVMQNAIAHSPDGKIDIIAHSMGGLVAKEYLSQLSAASTTAFVDKLILVGAPQLGAPQMLKALHYGDDLGFHIGPFELLAPAEVKSITQNMPAVYELLPSRRYTEIQGGYVIDNRNNNHSALDYDHTNEFLVANAADTRNPMLLAAADTFHAQQDHVAVNAPSVYNIVGCQNPSTAISYVLEDNNEADVIRGAGDGTVPIGSAMNLANSYQNYFSLYSENGADHMGLIGDSRPLTLIRAILANATSSLTLAPLGMSTSTQDCMQGRTSFHNATTIEISTHSPVTLNAYDSENRHTGPVMDAADTVDLQIPGSSYETIGENSFLLLPASNTYRIVNNAQATGTFTMKIKTLDEAANLLGVTTYINVPLASASTTATFTISSSTLSPTIALDADGSKANVSLIMPTAILSGSSSTDITPPEITMPDIPATVSYGTPLKFTFSASDELSGIAMITEKLDGANIDNGTITGELSEGSHSLKVEAVDNAGNHRSKTIIFQIVVMKGDNNGISIPASNAIVQVPSFSSGNNGTIQNRCKKKSTP